MRKDEIVTSALFDSDGKELGFSNNQMVKTYEDPETADANEIFKHCPDELLNIPKYCFGKGRK